MRRFSQTICTTIFYEAPHRLKKTLQLLCEAAGGERRIAVCKELTKKHENVLLFSLEEAVEYFEENEPRGEFVLVVEGNDPDSLKEKEQREWQKMSLQEHMAYYTSQGLDKKSAMKAVAKDRGVSKREIYSALL